MIEALKITNRRGLELAALFHAPVDAEQYPVVVALHGFSGYKEEEHIADVCEGLAKQGIGAIRFDASGYGESQGTVAEDFRFSNYLTDVEDVTNYLQAKYGTTHFGLWGHSMGGQLAVIYAADHSEVNAVCVVSAPISLQDSRGIKDRYAEWKAKGYREMTTSRYGTVRFPYAILEDRAQYTTLGNAKRVKVSTLVVWGDSDELVDGSETEQIFSALGGPKQKLVVSGLGHFYKKDAPQRKYMAEQSVDFFVKTLLPADS